MNLKKSLLFLFLSLPAVLSAHHNDTLPTVHLDSVLVSTSHIFLQASKKLHVASIITKQQIEAIPAQSINELIDYLPGVDVRSRGTNGVQADISMRGGTFDQVLVLINGINFTDPQTGHYNLDIPIDLGAIDRIEILQGTSMDIFGLSGFSGAINIITGNRNLFDTDGQVKANIAGGSHGLFNPSLTTNLNLNKWYLTASGEINRSSGYIKNTDYNIDNIFLQGKYYLINEQIINFQIGFQEKDFGSNSFYSLAYPNQYEATKTLFASMQYNNDFKLFEKRFYIKSSAYTRWHNDRFELFRAMEDAPSWYKSHNYHLTNVSGINTKLSFYENMKKLEGKTSFGIELRNENILSNVLGDALSTPRDVPFAPDSIKFTYGKNRLNLNYFAEQNFNVNHFTGSFGVSGNYNDGTGNHFCYGANLGYNIKTNGRYDTWHGTIFANINSTLRLPTFTDLYYHSATQKADPNLKPEEAQNYELGTKWNQKYFHAQANIYYRNGKNIIDWIKLPDETVWKSTNHAHVNAIGGEISVGYNPGNIIKNVNASYAFCRLDKKEDNYISKYALDYLKNKFALSLNHVIYKNFGADWQLTYQDRAGSYINIDGETVDYKPIILLDGKLYWQNSKAKIYVEATNITNRKYYDYGGVLQPQIWFKAGIGLTLGYNK